MKTFNQFLESKSLTREQFEKKTAEEQDALQKEYGDSVKNESAALEKRIEELEESKDNSDKNKEELKTLKKQLEDNKAEFTQIVKDQGDIIDEYINSNKGQIQALSMSLATQLKEQFDENKEEIENFISKKSKDLSFTLKAPTTMTVAGIADPVNVATTTMEPGLTDLRRVQPTLLDYLITDRTDASIYEYVEKITPEGAAAVVAETVLKPQVDFNIRKSNSDAVTIAAWTEVTRQMLRDVKMIAREIEREIVYQLKKKVQSHIATAITASAQAYTLTTVLTTTPNNYDATEAAITQMITVEGNPDLIRMNKIDVTNMNLSKGTTGYYIFPQFMTDGGKEISGLPVVWDNNIPVGTVSIVELRALNYLIHEDIIIRFSENVDDNFLQNIITMLGELSIHFFIKENDEPGVFEDTFSNIKTAITTP